MGDLENTLMQRQMPSQIEAVSQPAVLPTVKTKVPPAVNRAENAQSIQSAYANNWSPNPVLLRALLSRQG